MLWLKFKTCFIDKKYCDTDQALIFLIAAGGGRNKVYDMNCIYTYCTVKKDYKNKIDIFINNNFDFRSNLKKKNRKFLMRNFRGFILTLIK